MKLFKKILLIPDNLFTRDFYKYALCMNGPLKSARSHTTSFKIPEARE